MEDRIRYVLDVDDKGSPKLLKFGTVAERSGKQAKKGFEDAGKAVQELGNRIPGVGSAMGVLASGPLVGGAVAAAGLAAGFGMVISKSIDFADHMNDLSLRLGISTERLSVLSLYAEQSGTDIDTLASAMGKLGNKVAGGDKTLKAYGVTANSADEALFQLADKVAATEDPMMRLKIATDAFGKSGQTMLPLLVQGGAALREMGAAAPIVSTEMAHMADQFNDKMAEFKGQFVTIGLGIAESVLPQLLKWEEGVDRIRKAMGFLNSAEERQAKRNAIISQYGDVMDKDRADRERLGLGARSTPVALGGKTLRQSLAEFDAANAVPVDAGKKSGGYTDPDEAAKNAKEAKTKREQEEQDRVKEAQRINKLEMDAKWHALVKFEKEQTDLEQEGVDEAKRINNAAMKEQGELRAKFEEEQTAKAKVEADKQLAFQMGIANQMEGVFSSAFYNTLKNGDNLWDGLLEGFENMLIQMAAQMAARAVVFGILNSISGGVFGKAVGGLTDYVFRAGGGPYDAGTPMVTQERRAEAIIPRSAGRVAPTAKGGDTYNIVVQNPIQAQSTARALRRDKRTRNTGIN